MKTPANIMIHYSFHQYTYTFTDIYDKLRMVKGSFHAELESIQSLTMIEILSILHLLEFRSLA